MSGVMVNTRRYTKEILMKTTRSLAAVAVLALALPLAAERVQWFV